MESKGLIQPHELRRFCSAQVSLLLIDRYTWTTDEDFEAGTKLANSGPDEITGAAPVWSITATDGTTVDAGELPTWDLPQGELATPGMLEGSLAAVDALTWLAVELGLECDGDVTLQMSYSIWMYPESPGSAGASFSSGVDASVASSSDVVVTGRFDEETRALLADGETILLLPESSALRSSLERLFQPDFWNYEIFKRNGKPEMRGVLLYSTHPLFASFPTDDHADW